MLLIRNKKIRVVCGFIETLNLLALRLWVRNPRNARSFAGRVFRTYCELGGKGRWRSATIDEILGPTDGIRIKLEHLAGEGIFNPLDELAYLALLSQWLAPKQIFEIGTFRGRTTLNLALNSPDDCVIHTLDLPPQERTGVQSKTNRFDADIISVSDTGVDYRGKPESEKIRQHFGDSSGFDFSPWFGEVDLVYVDGAHHYEAVISDTRNALRMVKPGGWVVWHDFANYGDYNDVTRAVLSLLPGSQVIQISDSQLACYRKPR